MEEFTVTLDVYNTRADYSGMRVVVTVKGYDESDALSKLRTVYVSADGKTVNLTGGVGDGGRYYPEWDVVSVERATEGK